MSSYFETYVIDGPHAPAGLGMNRVGLYPTLRFYSLYHFVGKGKTTEQIMIGNEVSTCRIEVGKI